MQAKGRHAPLMIRYEAGTFRIGIAEQQILCYPYYDAFVLEPTKHGEEQFRWNIHL